MTNRVELDDDVAMLLHRAVDAGLAPGFSALVARDGVAGQVWSVGRSGWSLDAVEPDLRYDLASLTKPLATATLLLLARRDGLELQTPIGDVLPELAGTPWAAVTVLACATHSAGFPRWEPLYALGAISREGYLESLRRLSPIAGPGRAVAYSCPGFIALGLALERCGDADLAALFREMVAEPLGLEDEIGFSPAIGTPVAAGERDWFVEGSLLAERRLSCVPPPASPGTVPCDDGNARGLGGAAGNAGLFGTAAAVAAIASEFLPGGGALLTGEEAEVSTRCHSQGLEQARGIGWQLAATPGSSAGPALPPEAFGHTGFTGTSVWVDPIARTVHVLLGNRLDPGGRTPDLHPLRRRWHELSARSAAASRARAGLVDP